MVSFNLKDIVKPSINEIEKYIPGESLGINKEYKISKSSFVIIDKIPKTDRIRPNI